MRRLKVLNVQQSGPFRFGGLVPQLPLNFDLDRYGFFGCLPWLPDSALELSLFISTDDDELFDAERKVEGSDGPVKIFLHDREVPDASSRSPFFKRVYALEVGEEEPDEGEFEGQIFQPAVGNKLFGSPAVIHPSSHDLVGGLLAEGYHLYLQLDNPMYGDPHLGESWPFQDGLFFLFSRPDAQSVSWKWLWEHG